jgi:hypothetical protein
MSALWRNIWSGRASQEGFVDLAVVVLHQGADAVTALNGGYHLAFLLGAVAATMASDAYAHGGGYARICNGIEGAFDSSICMGHRDPH